MNVGVFGVCSVQLAAVAVAIVASCQRPIVATANGVGSTLRSATFDGKPHVHHLQKVQEEDQGSLPGTRFKAYVKRLNRL
jgi:hypothetical protein